MNKHIKSIASMQTNNKSLQYFTLCMLTTHYVLIAVLSPASLDDCQSPKNLIYHTQNSTDAPPLHLLERGDAPHISPFHQIIGTELFNIFLASRPCLLSVSAEDRITKTKGPRSFPRFTLGRQKALVTKQSKRFPSLA